MALDPNTQKYISTFINSQFPRLYEEYGQPFIDFVTAYYEWMETEGPLYDSRRASDYQDIDTTVDRFIIYFKDKYLQNIQLETRSNVELLVKHSLDVYRSRGTIRNIDLVFRLVFGTGADVYYPFDDVFSPSSGQWIIPRYLEVSTQDDLNKFVGKEIEGVNSGAQAFVESWVRKKAGSKQIDILYISALEGNFITGERINAIKTPFNLLSCPTMIGSLTKVAMTGGGLGFNVGDVLPILGTKGYGAKGRVANVAQTTGIVNFTLNDGGFGYTANAQVLVSQYVLSLTGVTTVGNTAIGPNYFNIFEKISQPLANINYQSAVGGHFANNDSIFTYFGNGSIMGTGICLASANGNSTNGQIMVSILSGNLQSNAIYNAGNVVSANVPVSNGYNDVTATGNVIAESLYFTANITNITGSFVLNEAVIQGSNTGTLTTLATDGATARVTVGNRVGRWNNTTITGVSSNATGNIVSINMNVGVINATGTFIGDSRAILKASSSNTIGYMPLLNQGTGATFSVSPTLLYPETVNLNTDLLSAWAPKALNGVYNNFAAFPTANLATPLATLLTINSYTLGRISALVGTSPGTGYSTPPMARVFEPLAFSQHKPERFVLTISGASSTFQPGDLLTQTATNARGLIVSANTSTIIAQKLSTFKVFQSGFVITATGTGTTATVTNVSDYAYTNPENISEIYIGLNADIGANTLAANGSITNLDIVSSGWGFEDGEQLTLTSANGTFNATGQARLGNQGKGEGFYRSQGGFPSSSKKLQDSDYYQVSSYEVRASVAFEHYKDMLKQLLHVAGTKPFGAFVYKTTANAAVSAHNVRVTQVVDGVVVIPFAQDNFALYALTNVWGGANNAVYILGEFAGDDPTILFVELLG